MTLLLPTSTPNIPPALSPEIAEKIVKFTDIRRADPQAPTTLSKEMITVPQGTIIPGSPDLQLSSSIFASIDRTRDGLVINSVLFDEDGYGRTYEDAWADFIASLRDKLSSLEKREAKLAAADRAILAQLRQSLSSVE